MIEFRYCR